MAELLFPAALSRAGFSPFSQFKAPLNEITASGARGFEALKKTKISTARFRDLWPPWTLTEAFGYRD